MSRIVIIADDLTGANDSAVQFAERGLRTITLLAWHDKVPEADVVAVSTESRNLDAKTAARAAGEMARALVDSLSPDIVFKKIDSTLRGNIDVETKAVADVWRRPVVVAPAYPQNGRTVRDGQLFVDGKPLSETFAAKDPLAPVSSSRVVDYFGSLTSSSGHALTISDASCQDDLDALVSKHHGKGPVLWVGSAGLARALAVRCSARTRGGQGSQTKGGDGPTLILIGSLNPVSMAQVEFLRASADCQVILPKDRPSLERASLDVADSSLPVVVVATYGVDLAGLPAGDRASVIRRSLSITAKRAVASKKYRNMVLSGGDVGFAVLRELGATAIEIHKEVLPGIAFGRVVGGEAHGMGIITKAGGFGDRMTLRGIIAWLRLQRGEEPKDLEGVGG